MATISIIDTDCYTALRSYLLVLAPAGAEVVQGIQNELAMPKGDFCVMTSSQMVRLATNVTTYDPLVGTGQKEVLTAIRYPFQVDFYGPNSQPWATMAKSLFRDSFAVDMFPSNIVPLHADDAVQMPLIDSEAQFEQRWRMSMSVQYNPVTTVGQDFATSLSATIKEVDAYYPPSP